MLDLDVFHPKSHPDAPMTFVCVAAWDCFRNSEGTPTTDYRAGIVWMRNVWLDEYVPEHSYYSDDPTLPDWLTMLLTEGD